MRRRWEKFSKRNQTFYDEVDKVKKMEKKFSH